MELFNDLPYWVMLITLFLLGFCTDMAWASWTIASNHGYAFYAANWSLILFASGILYTLAVVSYEWWLVVAYLVGGYLGTYTTVLRKHKKEVTL